LLYQKSGQKDEGLLYMLTERQAEDVQILVTMNE